MKKRKSIVSILYNNIVLTLIIFVGIAVIINYVVTDQLYNGAVQQGKVISESISNHLQDRMKEPERDMLEIQQVLAEKVLQEQNIDLYLENVLGKNPFFQAIEILDSQGTVLHAAPSEFQAVGMDRSGETFHKNLIRDGSFYWSKIFTLMLTGEPTIAVSSMDNGQIYVIYMDVTQISKLSLDYSSYFGDQINLVITDENGTYISSEDKSMIYQRAVNKDFEQTKNAVKTGIGYFESKDENALVNVGYIDTCRWYVSLYSSFDYVMAPIRNTNILFYLFFGITLALSYYYFRKAKALSGSIGQFSNQAREIAAGNYGLAMDEQQFKELQTFGENFNHMSKEIQERDLLLKEYAYKDILTGLPNRRAMMEQLQQLVEEQREFAMVYFDLDQFKNINDSCGHYTGDNVLKQVATRISGCIGNHGTLARIGGDEFLYVVAGAKIESEIEGVVKEIIESIAGVFQFQEMDMYMGISAGIAFYPKHANNVVDLLKYSDVAMYLAKAKGTNGFEYFTAEMHARFNRKIDIERYLRTAITREEFVCVFQPQIELASGRIIGFESLIRWNSAELGSVPPCEFIPVAEERSLIGGVTEWMLNQACEGLVKIQKRYEQGFKVSINVSVSDLKRRHFLEKVIAIIEKTGLDPQSVEIEITENMMVDNYDEVIGVLYKLKAYGICISLDDFGKGYSSLSYLNQLPIDTLKIDRGFLESSRYHEKGYQLISSIIDIAEKLQFTVVAEGIETDDQLRALKQINCFAGQGYLMCRPVPFDELVSFIDRCAQI